MPQRHVNRLISAVLFSAAVLLIFRSVLPAAESKVLGYYPAGVRDNLPAEKLDFSVLTHICHAFVTLNADGSLHVGEKYLYPELNKAAHAAGRKVLVSLGGGGGGKSVDGFPPVAANPALRALFIRNLLDFCEKNEYDGVDFDWEYPKNAKERSDHATLVEELRAAAVKRGKPFLITMANTGRMDSDSVFDLRRLNKSLDWFNVMTYDFHGLWSREAGHNSPLYSVVPTYNGQGESCYTDIYRLIREMGIPPEKLLLGLPFYGFELKASQIGAPCHGGRYIGYNDAVRMWAEGGWDYCWDTVSLVPYMLQRSREHVITFDNPESITIKCDFARVQGLGGVMIWALGYDIVEGRQLLLETVAKQRWDTGKK